jgi:hypothetical protein
MHLLGFYIIYTLMHGHGRYTVCKNFVKKPMKRLDILWHVSSLTRHGVCTAI